MILVSATAPAAQSQTPLDAVEGIECYIRKNANSGYSIVMMTNADNGFEVMNFVGSTVAKEYGWPASGQMPDASARILIVSIVKDVPSALQFYSRLKSSHGPSDRIEEGTLNFVGKRLLAIGSLKQAMAA